MLNIEINGTDYRLATTLRVAYEVQGQHNHKPYAEVFKGIAEMGVEQQIGIVYAAFKCANQEDAKILNLKFFQDYMLDHYNLKDLMDKMQSVVQGIMGEDPDAPVQLPVSESTVEGN